MLTNQLNQVAKKVLALMGSKNAKLDIHLVTESQIQALNKTFMHKDKPTTVLAFSHPKDFPSPVSKKIFLGEVYICKSYIDKHGEDIRFMLIHGILHLLGFDHVKYSDRIEMEKLEKKFLTDLTLYL